MTGTEHAHKTRESRDACAVGKCDKDTIVKTWPDVKSSEKFAAHYSTIQVKTLNNIEIVHLITEPSRMTLGFDLEELDKLITALQWAKWYLTEGKYDEQTA